MDDIKVVTVARGVRETNEHLANGAGWRIIGTQMVEEIIEVGPPRNARWVVMTTLGRPLREGEEPMVVAQEATAEAEQALAVQNARPIIGHVDRPVVEAAPDPAPVQEAPPVRAGTRKINKGAGEFEATGIRG